MSVNTTIQWCDSTVNPSTGCDGCELWLAGQRELCYAGGMTNRFGKTNPGLANEFMTVTEMPNRLSAAAKWRDLRGNPRLEKPWLDSLSRLIFVGDMSDSFSEDVSFEFLEEDVIDVVASEQGQVHQWQWLTKRPSRMAKFSDWLADHGKRWPDNLWAGTSVTTQNTVTRVKQLLEVGDSTTLRFVSVEPQWEAIDLGTLLPEIDWVIQGGMSGSIEYPFDIDWARQMRDACRKHQVPYFLKQFGRHAISNGERLKLKNGHGGDWSEWPKNLRVRQMPIYTGRHRLRSVHQRKC